MVAMLLQEATKIIAIIIFMVGSACTHIAIIITLRDEHMRIA